MIVDFPPIFGPVNNNAKRLRPDKSCPRVKSFGTNPFALSAKA
jgi:hypothetical protein